MENVVSLSRCVDAVNAGGLLLLLLLANDGGDTNDDDRALLFLLLLLLNVAFDCLGCVGGDRDVALPLVIAVPDVDELQLMRLMSGVGFEPDALVAAAAALSDDDDDDDICCDGDGLLLGRGPLNDRLPLLLFIVFCC